MLSRQTESKLIIFTGSSGVGKGTMLKKLLANNKNVVYSTSVTTRKPRPNEVNGKDYIFKSREEFKDLILGNKFLEYAEYAGNLYGTLKSTVDEMINSGKSVILEIELEGARKIMTQYPNALSIFILPPSFDELEKRLRGRNTETEEIILKRLQHARHEIKHANEFNHQIVNDDLEKAVNQLSMLVSC